MLEQKLYTVADVAELTGLTSRTIRNYLKDGTLRGRKIGVQWRFTEEDINRLFSEVDGEGQKVIQIEDVISAFLKDTQKQQTEGCLLLDIPLLEREGRGHGKQQFMELAEQAGGELIAVCEEMEEGRILRIALQGDTQKIQEFAARMKEY